jgi:hypothetical protein
MSDERETPASKAEEGHGVQVGAGNVQYNTWTTRPLDSLTVLALSPHTAAQRISNMRPDEAADLFASLPSSVAGDIFRVLFEIDQTLAVAILADVSPLTAAAPLPLSSRTFRLGVCFRVECCRLVTMRLRGGEGREMQRSPW